jgi:hypothetical protein
MEVILDNRRNEPNLKLINMEQVEIEKIDWLLYPFYSLWESYDRAGRSR